MTGQKGCAALPWVVVFVAVAMIAATLMPRAAAAAGVTGQTLHSFCAQSNCADGALPFGVIMDAQGNLYGTTATGGNNNSQCGGASTGSSSIIAGCGVVFELTRTSSGWAYTRLYSFCSQSNCADGVSPGGLMMDLAGNLYGTTSEGGGNANSFGISSGVVFKLTPNEARTAWTYSVLYSFCSQSNCTDGANPFSGLIMDSAGNLYGTTQSGGKSKFNGVVFKLTPNQARTAWTETVLYSFCSQSNCTDGEFAGDLIMDAAGNLYGATEFGGAMNGTIGVCGVNGCGVAFELTPNQLRTVWKYSVLYSFCALGPNCADGFGPGDVIMDGDGNLYGNAEGDKGGVIFKLTPNQARTTWTEDIIYSFCSQNNCADGDFPGPLSFDGAGNLLGTSLYGGNVIDCPGAQFNDPGCGVMFKLTPNQGKTTWTETVLYTFCLQSKCSDGGFPGSGVIMDAGGNVFGTTSGAPYSVTVAGGNYGTVFKLSGAGTPLSRNPQTADFDATGRSDILWQITNGQAAIWLMNGTTATTQAPIGVNPGPSWRVIGAGDFFGSLYSDILWQNLNGAVAIWQVNQTAVAASAVVGNPGTAWHAIATGDFNGDGYSDILWQNTNGAVAIWEMNGFKPIASAVIGNPGTAWHVIGAGDFNGDGYSDILWQNATNGAVAIWEMNGLKVIASAVVGNAGTSWRVIGAGDFNRDGKSDILWQNAVNGAVAIWEMNGLKVIASAVVGNPTGGWHVIGSGDYNGDGYSDILWQNANGAVAIWEMNGLKVTASAVVGNPGTSWHAIGE